MLKKAGKESERGISTLPREVLVEIVSFLSLDVKM